MALPFDAYAWGMDLCVGPVRSHLPPGAVLIEDEACPPGEERPEETGEVASVRSDIDLAYGVFLQLLVYSASDYVQGLDHQWPLFVDIESEGVALHGTVSGRREPTTPANRRLQARMLMERARRSLRAAESMFSLPDLQTSASAEACVAVLRGAQALLTAKGADASRFGEIVPAFEEEFVKAGLVDGRVARTVNEARRKRIACAYDVTHEETSQSAGAMLGSARSFVTAAEKRLKDEIRKLGHAAPNGAPDGSQREGHE